MATPSEPEEWLLVAALIHAALNPAWAFECSDYAVEPALLVELEPSASKGALSTEQKECLELRYSLAKQQTTKDKISRVLLVNAYAYSTQYWAELVQRHLDEVDRSDPDIAYLYAFYLFNTDSTRADEVVRWTEVALERRDIWTGDVFVSRVFGLMRLRSAAANVIWTAAEERLARGENVENVEELKSRLKTYTRDWADFAKVAGRDPTEALKLCMTTTAQARACGVEEGDL